MPFSRPQSFDDEGLADLIAAKNAGREQASAARGGASLTDVLKLAGAIAGAFKGQPAAGAAIGETVGNALDSGDAPPGANPVSDSLSLGDFSLTPPTMPAGAPADGALEPTFAVAEAPTQTPEQQESEGASLLERALSNTRNLSGPLGARGQQRRQGSLFEEALGPLNFGVSDQWRW